MLRTLSILRRVQGFATTLNGFLQHRQQSSREEKYCIRARFRKTMKYCYGWSAATANDQAYPTSPGCRLCVSGMLHEWRYGRLALSASAL